MIHQDPGWLGSWLKIIDIHIFGNLYGKNALAFFLWHQKMAATAMLYRGTVVLEIKAFENHRYCNYIPAVYTSAVVFNLFRVVKERQIDT